MTDKYMGPYESIMNDILEGAEKRGGHRSNIEMLINTAFRAEPANGVDSVKLVEQWASSHGLRTIIEGDEMVFIKIKK
ncbi:MAG: hypothetical protein PHW60_15905 [Kiritimatiellae bacterium]|nr:hypothetical protein [Kiritimatiellia bacterium]